MTTLANCVETIESSYEFMLAYAAQGRDSEGRDTAPSIRETLIKLGQALVAVEGALGVTRHAFLAIAAQDAARAAAAVSLVLATPNITSQLVDNLNATVHVRALLTSMFLADEALKQMKS